MTPEPVRRCVSVEEQIQTLRSKIEEARSEKARREALADQARGAHAAALAQLKELGHDSPESALKEAARLRSEVADVVAQIEEELGAAG